MGLYSTAKLIWGIPVNAYDENTGEPTPFWDEEAEDWRSLEGDLYVASYGHYEDTEQQGILTSKRVNRHSGDCWEPKEISNSDLNTALHIDHRTRATCDAALLRSGIGDHGDFFADARWWLVASFG